MPPTQTQSQPATPTAPTESFTYSKGRRAKEAKLAQLLQGKRQYVPLLLALLAVAVAFIAPSGLRYLLFTVATWFVMLSLYARWHLANLPAGDINKFHAPIPLELVLAPEVLAILKWPTNAPQLWQSLSKVWGHRFIVLRFGFNASEIGSALPDDEASMNRVWQTAVEVTRRLSLPQISASILTLALIGNMKDARAYLAGKQLSYEDLINGLVWEERTEHILRRLRRKQIYGGLGRDWAAGFTPLLNHFSANLSSSIEEGATNGLNTHLHQTVLQQMVTALSQPTKNSVALIGQVGSGKTTLIYSLAELLLAGQTSTSLRYHKVMSLNASVLISQVKGQGELEGLMLRLMGEAVKAKNIILFLDEAHLFFTDETGGVNLTNILLPVLEGGAVRFILAMEPSQWQKLVASAPSLTALVNQMVLPEPARDDVLNVMEDQSLAIEGRAKSIITYQAVQEAYRLAERYLQDQVFPGKGISLLETAINYSQQGLVTAASVQQAVEGSLGVKVSQASSGEKSKLLNLEAELHQRMINQDYAVKVVADALRRARAGVRNPNRPVGSFLFLGPTGVGKTELSKALASVYFGGEDKIVRLDMSEFAGANDASRLLESSVQNPAGFLTQVRSDPFAVVLLDEIEKAHPDILNLCLQLFDEGRLTDVAGREASFRDAIVIATSNAGADEIRQRIAEGQSLDQFSDEFVNHLINSQQFRPELINRFDEVVLFRPLTPGELSQVVKLLIAEVNKTLDQQKVQVTLTDAGIAWIVKTGNDPRLGARPMRRMIQRTVENVVAQRLLAGQAQPGQTITLDVADLESASGRAHQVGPTATPPTLPSVQ